MRMGFGQVGRALGMAVLLAVALRPPAALAHATVDTADGKYAVEFGFLDEPAYAGQPNALFVKIGEYGTGGVRPVDGLAGTLTAEVEKSGQTKRLDLVPQGEGVYLGPFVPTALGDYTFRLGGDINGSPVEIEESSSPTTFASVEPRAAIEFPQPLPDTTQVAAEAASARGLAETARVFGLAGTALGGLGVVLAGVALARRR